MSDIDIGKLSAEFEGWAPDSIGPEVAAWFQIRALIAIAQQLSVIAAQLKARQTPD